MSKEARAELTAQVIDAAAKLLRDKAAELERIAALMRSGDDLTYAAEALGVIAQLPVQCRVDLLVTRPLRALGNCA
jgi:hypothetical protein